MTTLLLFDIDGTLVLTGGAGQRAMACAFEELFAVPDAFRDVPMPGRTDTIILSDCAVAHRIPGERLSAFHDVYVRHLERELAQPAPQKQVMPGVRALLDRLSKRPDVHLALLTGNYERAARLKLEHFDLWRYFRGGAFGDHAPDRNRLVPRAVAHVKASGGPDVHPRDVVVIGDTPLDVACAEASGARSVAVATGGYTTTQLTSAGADVVFQDLSETDVVIEAMLAPGRMGRGVVGR